jgi:hypothetical protein
METTGRSLAFGTMIAACALALTPAPGLAGSVSPAACDFRAATVEALFAAANEADLAAAALAGGDGAAAASRFGAGANLLLAERVRVAREGKPQLAVKERRALVKTLRRARKRAIAGARAASKPARNAAERAAAAAGAIEAALAEQATVQATQGCVGGALRVPELFVAAGGVRRVPGGSAIEAAQGAAVVGELVVMGRGGLTITAAAGDLVLEGRIDARSDGVPVAAARTAATAARAPGGMRGAAADESCGDAAPVRLEAAAGNVRIGPTFVASAPDGAGCVELVVERISQLFATAEPSVFHAARGGDGGDVFVTANAGAIFFAPRTADDGPFAPGNGGDGEALRMDRTFVPPAGLETIALLAGDGGRSGRLELAAFESPSLPEVLYGENGAGGDGGSFEWTLREDALPFPAELRLLLVEGGRGGDATLFGGGGGAVHYQGEQAVVRVDWEKPAAVEAVGGNGGSVFGDAPYGSADLVAGGEGGASEVLGHRGRNGAAEHPDGAEGGDVRAAGGHGNAFPGPAVARNAGGRGADAYGRSGRGGDGFAACDTAVPAGGTGGAPGLAEVVGGDGGPSGGGRGGDGGSALFAQCGAPGRGGNGEPYGMCGGAGPLPISVAGAGGSGFPSSTSGYAAAPERLACRGDGVMCPDTPPAEACASPRFYTATLVQRYPMRTVTTTDTAIETCPPGGTCGIHHVGEERTEVPNGTPRIVPWDYVDGSGLPRDYDLFAYNFVTHCTPDGELHLSGQSGRDVITPTSNEIEHRCSGYCDCPIDHDYTACCWSDVLNRYRPCN